MKLRLRHLSLQKQISVLVSVLCLGLVLGAAMGAAYIAQQRIHEGAMVGAAQTAETMGAMLDRGMFERFREVRNIAALEPLRSSWAGDPATIRGVIEQLQKSFPDYAWIGFATPDGTVKSATQKMLEGESVGARPWFQDGIKGPALGDVHEAKLLAGLLGPSPNKEPFRFVDVATPVRDEGGHIVGVLGAHLSWSWADEVRRSLLGKTARQEEEIWILAGDGTTLLGPGIGKKLFSEEQIRNMQKERMGAFEETNGSEPFLTGFAVASGYRDYPGLGWIIVSRLPARVAFAASHSIFWTILGLGLAVAAAGLACSFFIARDIASPLQAITEAADRIGRDPNVTVLPRVGGSLEVTRLSSALRSLMRRAGSAEQRMAEASSLHEKNLSELRQLAETDALSGLLNRRGFDMISQDALEQFRRYGHSFAVLVVDIDFFKKINDTYGHPAGDEVIRSTGAVMQQLLRASDSLARVGGEEFVVLLREVNQESVLPAAHKLRRAIEAASVTHGGKAISVTASIGGAIVRASDRDIQDLVERADMALYKAKTSGRNRAVIDGLQPQLVTSVA